MAQKINHNQITNSESTDANGWTVRWAGEKRVWTKKTIDNPNRGSGGTFIDAALSTSLPSGIANVGLVNMQMTPTVSGNAGNWTIRVETAVSGNSLSVVVTNGASDWKDIVCYWMLTEV